MHMRIIARSRFVVACVALAGMLFIQFAAASCICWPTIGDGKADSTAVSGGAGRIAMADCPDMHAEQSAVCHVHANGDAAKQTLDKSELPSIQPFAPSILFLTLHFVDAASAASFAPRQPLVLTRATAPPLAIRHCCFRI